MKSFKLLVCLSLCIMMLLGMAEVAQAYSGNMPTICAVYIDDEQVGTVKFAARGLSIYDEVEKSLRESYEDEIFIHSNISFKELKAGSQVTDEKVLAQAMEEAIDIKINAYSIDIEGKKICHVKTNEDAQKAVDNIMKPYIKAIDEDENAQLEDSTIKEEISFDEELVSIDRVISPEKAVQVILDGAEKVQEYEVKEGDNIWTIAEANGVEVSLLEDANPEMKDAIIQPGDKVKIGKVQNLLTVVTKEKTSYEEEIDFDREVKEDNTLEKGKTKIIQEGEKGEKEITALITREDGQETEREIVEDKVIKEPVKHIEAKGTKEIPQAAAPQQSSSGSTSSKSSTNSSTKSTPPTPSRGSGKGQDVVNYAMKFLGYPYQYGSQGPNAFDCSGFTHYVYKQFGINISASSVAQRSVGTAVSKSNLRPGDLVCFSNGNHVGLYIGGGNFIHASTYKTGVKISNLKDGKYPQRYVTGRRLIN